MGAVADVALMGGHASNRRALCPLGERSARPLIGPCGAPGLSVAARRVNGVTVPDELADLPYADLLRPHTGPLESEGDYDTVHFDRLAFEDGDRANGARFLESAVTDCVLSGTNLRRTRINDLWVSGTRFTGVTLAESDWLDSSLTGCSLAGCRSLRFRPAPGGLPPLQAGLGESALGGAVRRGLRGLRAA